jgi:hypothetical protein
MGFQGEDLVLRTGLLGMQFWQAHTANVTPAPPPPAVDFSREMVLVSLLGTRPTSGYGVRITAVAEKACHLEVTVEGSSIEPLSSTGAVMPVITNPFHLVAVPRSLKEVRFIHTVEFLDLPLLGSPCDEGDASCR